MHLALERSAQNFGDYCFEHRARSISVSVHDREVAGDGVALALGLLSFEFGGQDAAGTN